MSRIVVKHGDTHPITFTVNADLTGSTVKLLCRDSAGVVEVLPSTVTDAAAGVVQHVLGGDLSVGYYDVELEITQGSIISTAPSSGFTRLVVRPDLG